jgi:aspartyl-tRNA(Asn)/glutamyl-tRNA(Gln) amidotransferase subunit A
MDQIGVLCADIGKGFKILSIIAGNDMRDGVMYPEPSYSFSPCNGSIRLAIPDNIWSSCEYAEEIIPVLKSRFKTKQIELRYYEFFRQVMYILSSAELCNNTNRYDGIKCGYRAPDYADIDELYINTRSEGFGLEMKLAAIVSAMVLSREYYVPYYEKAMKLRRLIRDAADFGDYDIIALPTLSCGTPYEQSALYALAALAGFPSISIPLGNHGIQLVAAAKNENSLYGAWEIIKRVEVTN